jgi:hypothetical protein
MEFEGALEFFLALSPEGPRDLSSLEDLSFLLDDSLSVAATLSALQSLTNEEIFIRSTSSPSSDDETSEGEVERSIPSKNFTFESLFQDLANSLVRDEGVRPVRYSFRPLYRTALKTKAAFDSRLLLI